MASKAIIVLESPWWTPDINKARASVLPFLQGMANYMENFSVYHSTFYERGGFKAALHDDLTHTKEGRLYLYVAAHGSRKCLGGMDNTQGIRLSSVLNDVRSLHHSTNIEGILFGACEIGGSVQDFIDALVGTRIAWIFGYSCEIDWLGSTILDLAVFENMMRLKEDDLKNRNKIINAFVKSLKKFDCDYTIGARDGEKIPLKDAITLVTKPRGRGNVPQDSTDLLTEKLGWG